MSSQQVKLFIPFVERSITSAFIKRVFDTKLFGKVVEIELHDKKVGSNDKLRSAKHNYAFITMTPYDTSVANNMLENVRYNYTTHVMFTHNNKNGSWEVKPHISVADRMKRGFSLHIKPDMVPPVGPMTPPTSPPSLLKRKSAPNAPVKTPPGLSKNILNAGPLPQCLFGDCFDETTDFDLVSNDDENIVYTPQGFDIWKTPLHLSSSSYSNLNLTV